MAIQDMRQPLSVKSATNDANTSCCGLTSYKPLC